MSFLLDSPWSETTSRLAVGIEPRDAVTTQRARVGVRLQLETNLAPVRQWRSFGAGESLLDHLPSVPQHASNRFAITMAKAEANFGESDTIRVRLLDNYRWYVPRRFDIQLADHDAIVAQELDPATDSPPAANRIVRPLLLPGSAHPRSPRATGIVGRVLRGDNPMRWCRVRIDDRRNDQTLLFAHGDDRGEFTSLLGQGPNGAVPTRPVEIRVHVFGPIAEPSSIADPDLPALDPIWDLPIEALPVPARGVSPDVEAGTAIPASYVESTAGPVEIDVPLGTVRSRDIPDFVFTAP